MILPPEVMDKILGNLPPSNQRREILIACALVATWWTGPSQRRLFSSVLINEDNHQRWVNGVARSGSKAHLLEHVRSLSHRRGRTTRTKHPIRDLAQESGEYLSALCNIRSLTLSNIQIEHINEDQFRICFSAFRETLTYLSLETVATSIGAFVALVDYFPNITTLRLRSFVLEPDEGPVPSSPRPFRGKLHVCCSQNDRLEFFDQFAKLDLEYEELVIDPFALFTHEKTKFLESAFQISASTVKFLRLVNEIECEQPSPIPIHTTPLPPPPSRSYIDDPRLSATARVGTVDASSKHLSQGPPLFNHLYRAPEDHHPRKSRNPLEALHGGGEQVDLGRRTIVPATGPAACDGVLSYPGGGIAV